MWTNSLLGKVEGLILQLQQLPCEDTPEVALFLLDCLFFHTFFELFVIAITYLQLNWKV